MNTRLPPPGDSPAHRGVAAPARRTPGRCLCPAGPHRGIPGHGRHCERPALRASVLPAQVPLQIHTVTVGGMPGWQITLIAAGAAVLAALLAVTADRVRAARRHQTAPSL